MALVKDYQGTEYDAATILKLSQQITASIDPKAMRGGVFSTQGESIGFNYDEATQLMGRPPTATEQVVLDMARYFAKEGVTDLKDADLTETNRRFGSTFTGGGGTIYEAKRDAEGNPVISTWSKDTSNKKTILTGLAIAAAVFGIPGVTEGLLSSAPAGATLGSVAEAAALTATEATAITAAEAAGLGLTAAEASSLGLSAAEFAAASAGPGLLTTAELAQLDIATGGSGGTLGAETFANATATGANVPTLTNLTGGSGLLTGEAAGITAESVANKLATDAFEIANAGAGAFEPTTLPPVNTTPIVTPPVVPPVVPPVIPPVIPPGVIPAITSLITPALQTTGGLLQQQTSREAAIAAQAMIDAETAAAKQAATFRPIGMTTRFGTSNFGFDPVTGQLTSAGYTLSPEAKNAQDRFVKLAESGLVQAEGAQAQFAPLQTGAQSLFGLGNKYLAQSPEEVASNYMKSQMALLAPGREQQYAFLQNKLQQQGRGGLSIAQGAGLADTSPEYAAFMNAKIQEDARLAANAQQYGQQNVLFGAGLLGQGSTALGNYYAGQTAAYSPYKTALGEVQNLETLGQQPLTMGIGLGEKAAQAGYNVGRLGLQGAGQSVALATGADATRNPAASAIGGLTSNPLFTNAINALTRGTPVNALDFGAYGTGDTGFQRFLEETYG